MSLKTTLLAAAASLAIATGAQAAPMITGSFSASGPAKITNPGVMIGQGTTLSFTAINTYVPGTGVLGSLAACSGSCGTGTSITLTGTPGVMPYTYTAANPILTLNNGLTISINSIASELVTPSVTGTQDLNIGANVTLNLTGYAATAGVLQIATTSTSQTITFTASGQASPVPEPASLAVLGGSLAALGMIRRRRAK